MSSIITHTLQLWFVFYFQLVLFIYIFNLLFLYSDVQSHQVLYHWEYTQDDQCHYARSQHGFRFGDISSVHCHTGLPTFRSTNYVWTHIDEFTVGLFGSVCIHTDTYFYMCVSMRVWTQNWFLLPHLLFFVYATILIQ